MFGTQTQGALTRDLAAANLAEGSQYEGGRNQSTTTDVLTARLPEQSAASGGEDFGKKKPTAPGKESGAPKMPGLAGVGGGIEASRAQAPGGGAGAGFGSGGLFGSGEAKIDPLNPGNEDPKTRAAMAEGGQGVGTSAGGVGKSASGGLGGGSSESASVAGGLFGGGTSSDFTGAGLDTGAQTDPLGSSDPDDYFTRISLENDLFKIVRARYHSTALRWRGEDSERVVERKPAPSAR